MAFSSSVEFLGGGFSRAHMQRRGEGGRKENIRGPRRGDKRKAEEDLEELRAAAAEACPTSAWNAMVAKARRLQHQAVFETRVAIRVAQSEEGQSSSLSSLNSIDREAFDADDDSQLDVDTQEYYGDDNELWQEIDEEGNLPASYQPPPRTPVPDPKDTIEATVLLSKFRPTRMSTEDLKKLLDARADPNSYRRRRVAPAPKPRRLGFDTWRLGFNVFGCFLRNLIDFHRKLLQKGGWPAETEKCLK